MDSWYPLIRSLTAALLNPVSEIRVLTVLRVMLSLVNRLTVTMDGSFSDVDDYR